MDATRAKVTQFRIACKPVVPYLMHSIYGLIPIPKPGCKTMQVDQYGRLYYDPAFVESISVETGVFTILHEVLHVILNHCETARKYLPPHPTQRQRARQCRRRIGDLHHRCRRSSWTPRQRCRVG